MIVPYCTKHYCFTINGKTYLISPLWMDILNTVGAIEQYEDSGCSPNLENITQGVGCYDSEAILDFLENLVSDGFLTVSGDCWYLSVTGSEFSFFI
jgi:hypothetical protein